MFCESSGEVPTGEVSEAVPHWGLPEARMGRASWPLQVERIQCCADVTMPRMGTTSGRLDFVNTELIKAIRILGIYLQGNMLAFSERVNIRPKSSGLIVPSTYIRLRASHTVEVVP